MNSHQFHYQVEALKDRYRCITYDHRGHGQSQVPDSGYDMENLYEDAVALIETLDCAPCHFAGLSTGGFIGLRLGIRRPDMLRSLILMETSADAETQDSLRQYKVLANVVRFLGFRLVIGRVMSVLFAPKFRNDPARQAEASLWKERIMSVDRGGAYRFGMGIWGRDSVYEQLDQIKTPTLVIVGAEDEPTPLPQAKRMVEAIPEARLEVIPDAGHSSTVEEPAAVTAAIERFLGSLS